MSKYRNETEIQLLAEAFSNRTLPQEQWTHAAHLTVALWHLHQFDFNESLALMRSKIISYNLSVGGSNTSTKGYHETLTVFWMQVIDFYIRQNKGRDLLDICNEFLTTPLASREMAFHFYKKETILSATARSLYIAPDKKQVTDEALKNILQKDAMVML